MSEHLEITDVKIKCSEDFIIYVSMLRACNGIYTCTLYTIRTYEATLNG